MVKNLKEKENSLKEKQFDFIEKRINEMINDTRFGCIKLYKKFIVKQDNEKECLNDIIKLVEDFIK
jgi:hypothetical protein